MSASVRSRPRLCASCAIPAAARSCGIIWTKIGIIHLDSRLQAALLLAQPCGVCADIGADHGRLSAALLQSGRAKQVLVADVSAPSLNKAKILLGGLGLSDRATFAVADGLRALDALNVPAETVFVLGMGGQTLSRILEEGCGRLHGASLVLGAQTDLPLCGIPCAASATASVRNSLSRKIGDIIC